MADDASVDRGRGDGGVRKLRDSVWYNDDDDDEYDDDDCVISIIPIIASKIKHICIFYCLFFYTEFSLYICFNLRCRPNISNAFNKIIGCQNAIFGGSECQLIMSKTLVLDIF